MEQYNSIKMASPQELVPDQTMEPNLPQTPAITNIFRKVENVFVTNSSVDAHANIKTHKQKCSVHEERSVDFLCVPCDEDICQLCKMSEHEGHETKSISLAAEEAKGIWMSVSSSRLKQYEETVSNTLNDTKMQMQDLTEAESTIERKINDRYSHLQCLIGVTSSESSTLLAKTFEERLHSAQTTKMQRQKGKCVSFSSPNIEESMPAIRLRQDVLLDMINKQKEQRIVQLKAMKGEAFSELETCVQNMEEELEAIAHLREQMDVAIREKNHVDILNLHRQLAVEFSAEQLRCRLRRLSLTYRFTVSHEADENIDENDMISDIFWNDQKDVVENYIQKFLGHAVKNLSPTREGVEGMVVQLKPAFQCSAQDNTYVKSICPRGSQRVMVSFAKLPLNGEGQTKMFDLNGKELELTPFGLCTMTSIVNSQNNVSVQFLPFSPVTNNIYKPANVSLFAKHEKHYFLTSRKGKAHCFSFYVIYLHGNDLKFLPTGESRCSSSMNILNTTAFDASRSGESFAVVNIVLRNTFNIHGFQDSIRFERELLILDRKIGGGMKSYKYKPPAPKFYPTDVCFLQVHGEEVLAIADMENDSIHLCCRSNDTGEYVFRRYLVEDHQLLKCPTALNTDTRGRLWVACKGGHLLVADMLFDDSAK